MASGVTEFVDSSVAPAAEAVTGGAMTPQPSVSLESDSFPEGSVDAGVYETQADGLEHGLVVLAMGKPCWLVTARDGHHLRVEPEDLDAVGHQLACFDRESIDWPPTPIADPAPRRKRAALSPLFWVLSVFAAFWAQGRWPGLVEAGLLDADKLFGESEWWRVGSALWLHADLGHLVSNAGGGLLVFSAVVATYGASAGWRWLLVSAMAGNLTAAALRHGNDYRSLGASTAVFAGLGLLAGRAFRVMVRAGPARRGQALWLPLVSGFVVLGLFGAGGVDVDVLAHATGFGAGMIAGLFAGGASVDS